MTSTDRNAMTESLLRNPALPAAAIELLVALPGFKEHCAVVAHPAVSATTMLEAIVNSKGTCRVSALDLSPERLCLIADKGAPLAAIDAKKGLGDNWRQTCGLPPQITSGTHRVGPDIPPGTYRTTGGTSCYWARLSGFGGSISDIIANNFGSGPQVVTISPSDAGFESDGCGIWEKVD